MIYLSKQRRLKFLRIIYNYVSIKDLSKNHTRGQLKYVFEYLLDIKYLDKFVKQGDILVYCDQRRNEDTEGKKPNYPDNSRQIEQMRRDKYPLLWIEIKNKRGLYFKFDAYNKKNICDKLIHKKDNFSKDIITQKLKLSNYVCSITGIPQDNGHLAADHFIPKEKGGKSEFSNCIIINKILNEKKNKKMPIEWFCESLLTNFMNICKNVGILEECKQKMIKFIQDF
jgi:5-methylcytosine-specific restriction endonuclease McrA